MKRYCLLLTIFVILFAANDRKAFSQIGPGGVGTIDNTQLWLNADKGVVTVSPSSYIYVWKDQSGHARDFQPMVVDPFPDASTPSRELGGLNGHIIVTFDALGGVNGEFLGHTGDLGITGSDKATVVIVAKNTSATDEQNGGLFLGEDGVGNPGETRGYNLEYSDAVRFNGESQIYDNGHTNGQWKIVTYSNPDGATVADYKAWLNGTSLTGSSSSATVPSLVSNMALLGATQNNGVFNPEGYFDGSVAEVVVFSSQLNDATRVVIDNSLAAKYNLPISDDHYSFESSHSNEVSGIAGYNGTTFSSGWSSNLLSINSPDDLSDGEYLMYGHDNGDVKNWVTTEVPASGTRRLAREWRVDETGEVGNVTVTVPSSSLPALTAGFTNVGILVDDDGDFTSGATMYEMKKTAGNYNVTLNLNSGQFITIIEFVPQIYFTVTSAEGLENVKNVTVAVRLNYPVNSNVSATFNVTGGTATNGTDYTLNPVAPGQVTIPSGSLSTSFSISVVDDPITEPDETIILGLSNPTAGVDLGLNSTYTYTIKNNDFVYVTLSTSTASENEGNVAHPVSAPVLVVSGGALDSPASVNLTVTNGTASATDWSQTGGTITIPVGDYTTPKNVSIPSAALSISGDFTVENNETINLNINNFTTVIPASGAITNCTYTIVNDDNATASVAATTASVNEGGPGATGTGTFTFSLSNPSDIDRTVTYSAMGSASAGTDYTSLSGSVTIPANATSATVPLNTIADLFVEGDETVSVVINSVSGTPVIAVNGMPAVMTIIDDDAPKVSYSPSTVTMNEGGTATVEVWLDNPPLTPVTLNVSTIKSGLLTVTPVKLTFTSSNYSVHQTINLQAPEDNTMGDKTDDVIISVDDATSDNHFDPLPDIDIPVTIINNDVASILASPASVTVGENETATFTVSLSAGPASGNVVIDLSSGNINVATTDKAQLTFNSSNWNIPQTVTVTGVNNNTIADESTTINLSVNNALSDDNYDGKSASVAVNVTNDDVAGFVVNPTTLNLKEEGPAGSFTVVLTAQPLTDVVIDLTNPAPVYVSNVSQITFTSANWNTPQTVTVTPIEDALDLERTDLITLSVNKASSDNSFDALPSQNVNINIDDDDPPVISGCPSDITLSNEPGKCTAIATWTPPTSTAAMTSDHNPGDSFPAGTTIVTYTSTDTDGTSTCSFKVIVNDTQNPVFTTCPVNISQGSDVGGCAATVNTPDPVLTDNCGVTVLVWALTGATTGNSPAAGINFVGTHTFNPGVTTVTYIATDAKSNSATCSYTVTVSDTQKPVFTSCPTNMSKNNDAGVCTAAVNTPDPVITDNCGVTKLTWKMTGATVASSAPTGINKVGNYTFNRGLTTVTYTAVDGNSNTTSCSFNVTVTDTEKPIFSSCPVDINQNNDAGLCTATVINPNVVVNDNCGVVTLTWAMTGATVESSAPTGINNVGNHTFNGGETTVTYTATDDQGNFATCSYKVTVHDIIAPEFTSCPSDISQGSDAGGCSALITTTDPMTDDNCGITSLTWELTGATTGTSPATGINYLGKHTFNAGTTSVTYTAADASGNNVTCSYTVKVTDTEKPSFTLCPSNISQGNDVGNCAAEVLTPNPAVTDNCGVANLTWELSGATTGTSPATGINNLGSHLFNNGETTVTYTVTDASGNNAICTFKVTVTDTEKPVFSSCPADMSQDNDASSCTTTVNTPDPVVTDNCGVVNLTWTMTGATIASSAAVGINNIGSHTFNGGETTVTYTVTDAQNNFATCSFKVTVNDIEAPVFGSCPADISQGSDAGGCTASIATTDPAVTDNCGVTALTWELTGATTGTSAATGINNLGTHVFNPGETTVTYTAEDSKGNSTTCSYKVTIKDTEKPVFTSCPSNISQVNDAGGCSATVTTPDPVTADNCGVTTLTWVLTGATTDASALTGINNLGTHQFNGGKTTVTYTVKDANDNSATCTFDVDVSDNEPPAFTTCPSGIAQNNDPGVCTALVNIPDATVTDNCGLASLIWELTGATTGNSPATGINQAGPQTFNNGETTITYTATDNAGNTSTCTYKITVSDTEKPAFTNCPSDVNVNNDAGLCSTSVTTDDPVFSDNCGVTNLIWTLTGATVDSSPLNGINYLQTHTFNGGETTVTYTAADAQGNTEVCSYKVNVTDNEVPSIACVSPATPLPADDGQCYYTVTDNSLDPVVGDNCGVAGVINNYNSEASLNGAAFPIGTTTVDWTVTDNAGLTSVCTQTIEVADVQAPVILSCPDPVTDIPNEYNQCYATGITLDLPVVTDNCGVPTVEARVNGLSIGDPSTYQFPVGVTTIEWVVTDAYGNVNTCNQTVEIIDTQSPLIVCPGNMTKPALPDECGAVVTWKDPIAYDNCPGMIITSTHKSGDFFPVGVTMVNYTATDGSGNTANCSFRVTVNDGVPPVVIPNDTTMYLDSTGSLKITPEAVTDSVSDNCGLSSVTLDKDTFNCSNIGVNTVTITASDNKGLITTATAQLTVLDTIPPVMTCMPATIYLDATGNATVSETDVVSATSNDNCTTVSYILDRTSFTCSDLGDVPVKVTATDGNGNVSECTTMVTVSDTLTVSVSAGPDIEVCDADPSVNISASHVYNGTVLWSTLGTGTFDDATLVNPVYTFGSEDKSGVTLIVTATKINGCTPSVERDTVKVMFVPVPVISAGPDITTCTAAGSVPVTEASATGGTITWTSSGDGNFTDPSAVNPVYNLGPTDTGTITLTMTSVAGTCAPMSDDMLVTLVQSPVANPGPGGSICVSAHGFQITGSSHSDGSVTWSSSGDGTFDDNTNDNPYYTLGTADASEDTIKLTMTVTGTGLCPPVQSTILILLLPTPHANVITHNDISCNGLSDGKVAIEGKNGIAPYQYGIDGSAYQNSGEFMSLTAGPHLFSVLDSEGCSGDSTIVIVNPDAFTVSLDTIINISCFGKTNGEIHITPAGGTKPYNIAWTGPDSYTSANEDISSLAPGSYSLSATDANGCATVTMNETVTQPSQIAITIDTVSDRNGYGLSCNGGADGFINVTVSGGSGKLAMLWSGPSSFTSTDEDILNLAAGNYILTVTDTASCIATQTVALSQPEGMNITLTSTDASCPYEEDGGITVVVQGGAEPLAFLWNDGNTGKNRTEVTSGDYSVIVTDANGCSQEATVTVNYTGYNCLKIPEIITPNGDGHNDKWELGFAELYPKIEVKVFTRWGKLVYSSRNPAANPWDGTFKGKLMPNDSYHYIINLHDGSEPRSGIISIISK